MKHIDKADLFAATQYSDIDIETLQNILDKHVYPNKNSWKKFLSLLILTLGIGLSSVGIIFFFAYNWDNIHHYFKLGVVQALAFSTVILALKIKSNNILKQLLLLSSTLLVGVMFAVYGQVYQTGANAFDFFLAWFVFTIIWAYVSNFAPTWLLSITLLNTTVILYYHQASTWSTPLLYSLLSIGNSIIYLLSKKRPTSKYLSQTVGLAVITYATLGILNILFNTQQEFTWLIVITVITIYGCGTWVGIKTKSSFHLSCIPLSVIIMTSAWLLKQSDDQFMFLTVSLFIIISVTLVIKNLISLQKTSHASSK